MTWTLEIPGANLVAAGKQSAHVTDTLGAGHVLCDPIGFKVQTVRGSTVVDVTSIATLNGAPGDSAFTFDLAGPFDANVTYRVTYQSCTPDGQIDPSGTTYDNTAQIEGWGTAGEGVGKVTNKPWQETIGKSGSVLGGGDRTARSRGRSWSPVLLSSAPTKSTSSKRSAADTSSARTDPRSPGSRSPSSTARTPATLPDCARTSPASSRRPSTASRRRLSM